MSEHLFGTMYCTLGTLGNRQLEEVKDVFGNPP